MRLRVFAGLIVAVAFVGLPPGGSPRCVSHGATPESALPAHDGMAMPDPQPSTALAEGCGECRPPSGQQPPCDHGAGMTGACASMASCTTATAEPQTMDPRAGSRAPRAVAGGAATPRSLSVSPDTPPPRV